MVAFDGANSMTGAWMGLEMPNAVGEFCIRGMAVFPDGHSFREVWPLYLGTGIRMAMVPMTSTKVYYFIIWAGCESEGDCSTSFFLTNLSPGLISCLTLTLKMSKCFSLIDEDQLALIMCITCYWKRVQIERKICKLGMSTLPYVSTQTQHSTLVTCILK